MVPRLPSVEAMMANDEASRGLGIELVDRDGDVIAEFRGRSHQVGPVS